MRPSGAGRTFLCLAWRVFGDTSNQGVMKVASFFLFELDVKNEKVLIFYNGKNVKSAVLF